MIWILWNFGIFCT